jgi:hypothetical protein
MLPVKYVFVSAMGFFLHVFMSAARSTSATRRGRTGRRREKTIKITPAVTPTSVSLCTVHFATFCHPHNCHLGISATFLYVPTQMSCLIIINLNIIMFLVSLLPLTQNSKILSSRIAVATLMAFFKIVSVANGEDLP